MPRLVLLALPLLVLLPACGSDDVDPRRVVLSHGANSRPYLPWPAEVAKQLRSAQRTT